ncbi:expressed protein [Phakopsora pachyrhizi]|uniref:Expressed protein n=1 Tax=Phakopsora pachyrhizi TaxID=170000 RepID=A0AAV0BUS8_PHAPC|nr:expressed protein [Phakopsora pachyrhizi]
MDETLNSLNSIINDSWRRIFFSWVDITFRSLDCLLLASPDIDGEGLKIVQEILKDKEVLEMIEHQFSITILNRQFWRDIYINFDEYLKGNSWSKGITNIFDELSKENQYNILIQSIKFFIEDYKNLKADSIRFNNDFQKLRTILIFFQEPEKALYKLANNNDELSKSVAEILIEFVSNPDELDYEGEYSTLWLFSYYIVEYLIKDQNTKFFQLYESQIVDSLLLEKINILKTNIDLKKQVKKLVPEFPDKNLKADNKVLELLADDKIIKWFNNYLTQLNQFTKAFKFYSKELSRHQKNYRNLRSKIGKHKKTSEKIISAKLGTWINSKMVRNFWRNINQPMPLKAKKFQSGNILSILKKEAKSSNQGLVNNIV